MLPTNPGGGSTAATIEVVHSLRSSTAASTTASSRATTTTPASELTAATAAPHHRSHDRRPTEPARPFGRRSRVDERRRRCGDGDDGADTTDSEPQPTDEPTTAEPATTAAATTTAGATVPTDASTGSQPRNVTPATIAVSAADGPATSAIAVSVGSSLVLTTAAAVSQAESVTLACTSGRTTQARVMMTHRRASPCSPPTTPTPPARSPPPRSPQNGDMVTLLTQSPSTSPVTVADDGSLQMDWDTDDVAEGTPVVNAGGQLVGLCRTAVRARGCSPSTSPPCARRSTRSPGRQRRRRGSACS